MKATAGRHAGKVAIVTGGASGIGLACCERLAAEGAAVGVLDIDGDAAERVANAIREGQGSALAFQADVADPNAIASAVSQAVRALGRLDLAVNSYPEAGAYVASKHGLIGLARAAALGWGTQNIRVVAVCPTFTPTPMTNRRSSEEWEALAQKHALRRLPDTDDVAATVSFLGSQDARSLTGSVHIVDAGYTAG
jgi:NAD(P)-dependent dehydrogenase (short-subunit alcohol dehydrogenase family)